MDNQQKILEIEERIVDLVAAGWRTDVEAFKAQVVALCSSVDGHDISAILPQVMTMVAQLQPPAKMSAKATTGISEAHTFAVAMVAQSIHATPPHVEVSPDSLRAVKDLDKDVAAALKAVHQSLQRPMPSGGMGGVLAALNPVLTSPNKVEVATAWAVNNASNAAVHAMASELGKDTVWIAERDACLDCTAYAGERSTADGFPAGLTFGAKPLKQQTDFIAHPPLHPRCRCMIETNITQGYADALKREAVRSVLRGISLPSESDKARVAAAKALLEKDPVAPASVKKYAQSHIKKGAFRPKGSTVG